MRILILDNNINFSKELASLLSNKEDIEVVHITRDRNNIYEKIMKYEADIVIIDYYLPKEPISALLKKLNTSNNEHPPLCIVTFPDFNNKDLDNTPIHDCLNEGAYGYFIKGEDKNDLVKRLIHIAAARKCSSVSAADEKFKNELTDEITELIRKMSIPFKLKGFNYIREAILLSYYKQDYLKAVTKELYFDIAENLEIKRRDDSKKDNRALAVERAIRNAISKGNFDNNIYNFVIKDGKTRPTNAEFLKKIVKHLLEKPRDS